MAKNDTALLQDISGQLRKLNQTSTRDKLQEREASERQEAIWQGATMDSGFEAVGGENWIGATEDFKRRFVASTAGMYRDIKLKPAEKEAEEELKGDWFEKINLSLSSKSGTDGLWQMINDHWLHYFELKKGSRLSDEENRRESPYGPGMHPNSKAFRIKKGWNANESELDPTADPKKKTWIQKLLGYPKTMIAWVVASVGTALYDVIKGYETGGVTGAIAAFFGGTGEGGLASGIKGAFKGVGIGIAAGFMVGGPIGALVGGLIGGVAFAITGALGKDKLEKWLNDSKERFSKGWEEAKTNVSTAWNAVSDAIYHKDADGNAVMFGSLLKWDPDDEDGKLEGSWLKVADYILKAPGMFAAWLEKKVRALLPTEFADAIFGDSPETIAKKALLIRNPHLGEAIITKSMKSVLRDQVEARINEYAARGDVYTGVGSVTMDAILENLKEGKNVDAKGDEIEIGGEPGGIIESLLDSARDTYLAIGEWRKRDYTEGLVDGRTLHEKGPLILVDDKSDKSTTTTTIINSTYIDHILGNDIGSGNNPQVYQADDGNIYSWQP